MPNQIDPTESLVKHALDNGEFVDCIAILQRSALAINVNDLGSAVLALPDHPLVNGFIRELRARNAGRADDMRDECGRTYTIDLKTARKNLKAARHRYDKRVGHRMLSNSMTKADARYIELGRYSSLSSILIDREEAAFWRKIVKELEYFQRIKWSNARKIASRQASRELSAAFKKVIGVPHE